MALTDMQINFAKKTVGLNNFVGDEGPYRYFSQDIHVFRMKGNDGEAKAFYATQPVGMRFDKKMDLKKMKIYKFDQLMTDANRKVNARVRAKSKRIENLEERLNDAESVNDRSIEERIAFWLALIIVVGAVGGSIYYFFREGETPLTVDQMRTLLTAVTSASVSLIFIKAQPKIFEIVFDRLKPKDSSTEGDE